MKAHHINSTKNCSNSVYYFPVDLLEFGSLIYSLLYCSGTLNLIDSYHNEVGPEISVFEEIHVTIFVASKAISVGPSQC